ncbi:hypothetical protein [Streptococcus suis]|uniref:hypothetical protein n=1 Tax=Streptococcus suis TaxID=1307 RepID=UPI001ABDEBD7|nr:hypothetical protein [Streptococcus suis]
MVNKKKMAFIALILGLFLLMPTTQAKEQNQTSQVSAYYYYNNNPIYSIQIQATNYQVAFEKIRSGTFENNELDHYTVDDFKKLYEVKGKTIRLSDTLVFGEGVELTEEESKAVLEVLYRDNRPFLNVLNEFQMQVPLHIPENARYRFTSEEGLSIAELKQGWTIFQNSNDNSFEVIKLDDKEETVYLGNTLIDQGTITVDATKIDGYHTADIGESVTYKIPLESISSLELEVSPNFIIDEINAPFTEEVHFVREKKGQDGTLVNIEPLPANVSLDGEIFKLSKPYSETDEQEFETALSKLQAIKKIKVDVNSRSDEFITVTGHVVSTASYLIDIYQSDTEEEKRFTKNLVVENQNIRQGIYVIADGKYLLTPQVYSNNVNFVMTDGNSHELLTGAEYILGRFDKSGQVSILNYNSEKELSWEKSELEKGRLIEAESNFTISGNQIIYLDGYKSALPFNEKIWAYDESNQTKSNEALFKLRGLSGEYTYFLKQVNGPEGYAEATDVQIFKATKDSESKAQFGDYQVNGFILDLDYGKTEYNALQILKEGQNATLLPNPYWMALIFIVVTILVVADIAYLVIRKG